LETCFNLFTDESVFGGWIAVFNIYFVNFNHKLPSFCVLEYLLLFIDINNGGSCSIERFKQ